MPQNLTITFPSEVTEKYLKWARKRVEAEVNESVEPSGVEISIRISGPFGADAYAMDNGEIIEFGDVVVELAYEQ